MKKDAVIILVAVLILFSCVSTGNTLEEFFFLHGAELEEGPMVFVFIAPNDNSLALKRVNTYTEEMVVDFRLQTAVGDGAMNGFLVLGEQENADTTITAGVYIGGGEYVIEGPGVMAPIHVPIDFDRTGVFEFSVLINFEKGFIELRSRDREIGTGLAPHMIQVDLVGYHAKSTRTHFSEIKITGN